MAKEIVLTNICKTWQNPEKGYVEKQSLYKKNKKTMDIKKIYIYVKHTISSFIGHLQYNNFLGLLNLNILRP